MPYGMLPDNSDLIGQHGAHGQVLAGKMLAIHSSCRSTVCSFFRCILSEQFWGAWITLCMDGDRKAKNQPTFRLLTLATHCKMTHLYGCRQKPFVLTVLKSFSFNVFSSIFYGAEKLFMAVWERGGLSLERIASIRSFERFSTGRVLQI
jgi:hypothetical protein